MPVESVRKEGQLDLVFPVLMENDQGVVVLFWLPNYGVIVGGGEHRSFLVGVRTEGKYDMSDFRKFYGEVTLRNPT